MYPAIRQWRSRLKRLGQTLATKIRLILYLRQTIPLARVTPLLPTKKDVSACYRHTPPIQRRILPEKGFREWRSNSALRSVDLNSVLEKRKALPDGKNSPASSFFVQRVGAPPRPGASVGPQDAPFLSVTCPSVISGKALLSSNPLIRKLWSCSDKWPTHRRGCRRRSLRGFPPSARCTYRMPA